MLRSLLVLEVVSHFCHEGIVLWFVVHAFSVCMTICTNSYRTQRGLSCLWVFRCARACIFYYAYCVSYTTHTVERDSGSSCMFYKTLRGGTERVWHTIHTYAHAQTDQPLQACTVFRFDALCTGLWNDNQKWKNWVVLEASKDCVIFVQQGYRRRGRSFWPAPGLGAWPPLWRGSHWICFHWNMWTVWSYEEFFFSWILLINIFKKVKLIRSQPLI